MLISSVPIWNFEPMYDQTSLIDVVSESEVNYPTIEKCDELIILLGAKISAFDPLSQINRDISPFITDKFIDFFKYNPTQKILHVPTQSDQYHNVFAYNAGNNRYYLIVFSIISETYCVQEIEDHTIFPVKNNYVEMDKSFESSNEIDMPEFPPVFRRSHTSDYDLLSSLDQKIMQDSNDPSIISTSHEIIELPHFCPILRRTDNSFDTLLGNVPPSSLFDDNPSISLE